jgi:site-specific DNA-methyltransferase (adenine-specific)
VNPYFATPLGSLYQGNALAVLAELEPESVDVCFTSPPYWGLRNYGTEPQIWDGEPGCAHEQNIKDIEAGRGAFCSLCGAWYGELGLEPSLRLFTKHIADILDQLRRILKPSGALWIDIGDSYAGSGRGGGDWKNKREGVEQNNWNKPSTKDVPEKSRCGIPERLVVEMLDRGWCYRNHIIWEKINVKPESALDRFVQNFEDIFFFTLGQKYFFQTQREPQTEWAGRSFTANKDSTMAAQHRGKPMAPNADGRLARAIWRIHNSGFEGAHTATFPLELLRRPLAATLPPGGVVLDPFMGSGTVAEYAERNGARWIGIELSLANCEIIRERVSRESSQLKMQFQEEDAV